ncbi:MAG: COG4315 family predicted lipoprotein [Acetobacteraceae bacterium]
MIAIKTGVAVSLTLGALLAASAAAPAAEPEKLVTQHSASFGTYLSDDDGHAAYLFTADSKGKSVCEGACAKAWPPMMTSGAPVAGPGVDAKLLGTIPRGGGMQVTYDGMPLYYYVGDNGAGSTAGEGIKHFGGEWYLLAPNGGKIDND